MTDERKTLTIEEVSRILGLSKNSTYLAAQRGELPVPALRIGRRLVVPREALFRALGVDASVVNGGSDGPI